MVALVFVVSVLMVIDEARVVAVLVAGMVVVMVVVMQNQCREGKRIDYPQLYINCEYV